MSINRRFPSGGDLENARDGAAIVTSDSETLRPTPRAVYVGTGGTVIVDFPGGGENVPFVNVPSGSVLNVQPARIRTASTADDFVALY